MNPGNALALLLVFLSLHLQRRRTHLAIARLAATGALLIGFLALAGRLGGAWPGFGAATGVFLLALSNLLSTFQSANAAVGGQIASLGTAALAIFSAFSYLYGVQEAPDPSGLLPSGATTNLCLLILAWATFNLRKDCGLSALYGGKSLSSRMARILTFYGLTFPPFLAWLRVRISASLVGPEIATLLTVIAHAVVFNLCVWFTASRFRRIEKEREASQAALAKSELKFRRIYDSGMFGVLFWNEDGTITDANEVFLKMLGYSREELERGLLNYKKMTPLEYADVSDAALKEVKRTGFFKPFDKVYLAKDGKRVPVLVGGASLPKSIGIGGIAIAHDLSDRKRAEEQRAESMAREQAALHASEMKTRFVASVSHEMRTPLNVILGAEELLSESSLSSRQRELVEVIHNSANGLRTLIQDILELSKIEAGALSVENTAIDLPRLLQEMKREQDLVAKHKGLEVKLELGELQCPVRMGDPARIRQILNNLVSNAIKFTDQGSIVLRVSAADSAASRLRFEVSDTGIGITREQLSELFMPFVQVDSSTTRKYGGSGLGLSICKHLVGLMNGEIGVQSEPGRGSCFWFELPMAKPDRVDARSSGIFGAGGERHLQGQRVLLVEDVAANQMVLKLMLLKLGCTVEARANGKEALDALDEAEFDIIFMDCQMPVMDGYTAATAIRSQAATRAREVPIVALTANALDSDRERCLAAGMSDYLAKPISMAELSKCLERWVPIPVTVHPRSGLDVASSGYRNCANGRAEPSETPMLRE